MPSEYTAWKKAFLKEWLKLGLGKFENGIPLAVALTFYIKPPQAIAKVKKNRSALENESLPVVKKPDLDNLEKSVLDAINGYAWVDDNQVTELNSKKLYSLNPRVEIEILELGE
jgi:Holliday junction resolvase RusA-like endonuclease